MDESTGCGKPKPALRVTCEQLEDDINLKENPLLVENINLNEKLSPVEESTGCEKPKPALRVACEQLEDNPKTRGRRNEILALVSGSLV